METDAGAATGLLAVTYRSKMLCTIASGFPGIVRYGDNGLASSANALIFTFGFSVFLSLRASALARY
jgi:hypothetical protein